MSRARRLLLSLWLLGGLTVAGCVDTTVSEPVPVVQPPDWNQQPIFGASFSGGISPEPPPEEPPECKGMGWGPGCSDLLDSARGTADSIYSTMDYTSAATGGGDVFVSGEGQKLVRSYDGTTLAHKQSFSHPELTAPRALTYYRGELFVVEIGEIYVFDAASGAFKRRFTHPDQFTTTDYKYEQVAPTGIDAAWGELWITFRGGWTGGGMTVLDAVAGTVKAVHLHQPKQELDTVFTGCTDPVTAVMNLQTCANQASGWAYGTRPSPTWSDLATVPEEHGVMAQCRFIQRGDLTQPVPTDTDLTFDPLSNDACDSTGPQDGVDAVWGMHWYLTVESSSDGGPLRVNEYGIEPDRSKPWLTPLRRSWTPVQGAPTHEVRYDVAYQTRETRVDWSGPLKGKDWLRGTKCANYVVSDGDIFVTGKTGERWYEPARGFQKIELRFNGVLQDTKFSASGQLCGNTDSVPSGPQPVELRAYVNNGSRQVFATNLANFDHNPPAGNITVPAENVNAPVTISGTMQDAHSGSASWALDVRLAGGSWRNVCTVPAAVDQGVNQWAPTCVWDAANPTYPEGLYEVRSRMTDLVTDANGGANVGYSNVVNVRIDRTPPTATLTGDLREAQDYRPLGEGMSADLIIDRADVGGSGVAKSEVLIDGLSVNTQECPASGCPGAHAYLFAPEGSTEGNHEVAVVVYDRAGNMHRVAWPIDVEVNLPPPDEDPEESQSLASPQQSTSTSLPALPELTADPLGTEATGSLLPCEDEAAPIEFPHYSLGPSFEGMTASAALRRCDLPYPEEPVRANFVSYIYGDCLVDPLEPDGRCAPPLEIQSWPGCERSLADYTTSQGDPLPHENLTVRGTPAAAFADITTEVGTRLEVYTGQTTVVIFGFDVAQVRRAADAILEERTEPPALPSALRVGTIDPGRLPAAVPGALTGQLEC